MNELLELKNWADKIRTNQPNVRCRRWPNEFKAATKKLVADGMSSEELFHETGVPVQTIYSWSNPVNKKPKPKFKPVKVETEKNTEIKLCWPSGLEVSGLKFEEFSDLLKRELL